ncbi:hypothetical protein B0H14DRAFT_3865460 [Mycena olivaceomarginata]|nr:hypothetical protein B0H14DRAFT_3865460 [Mycena olivaceomarginata]
MPLPPAARGVPLPFPPLPFRDSLRPLLELPLPLPADLGELDLLAPVLCAFPLELELELELGCAESRRSSPASADGRLGRLPGIFGRLGVNFDVEFAPGAAPTLAARCSPAPALARKMEIPVLEAPVLRFEYAVLNTDALLDADGEAEENDAPTALRSAAAASGAQSRAPTVTHSSAGSSLARRGSSRSTWGWWRGYGCCRFSMHISGAHSESLPAPPFRPCVLSFSSPCLYSIHRTAIHVRRGDFAGWCPTTQPVDECFAPLSTYARRVEEVREELQRTRGIEVQRVVLTSDETNATWWEEVAAYGWHRVDHSTTAARPREGGAKEVGEVSRGEPNRVLGDLRQAGGGEQRAAWWKLRRRGVVPRRMSWAPGSASGCGVECQESSRQALVLSG